MSTTPTIPRVEPEPPGPPAAAMPVTDKRTVAEGAVPKQMQSWIFLGVISVIAVGIWFSGLGKKTRSNSGSEPARTGQAKPAVGGLTPEEVQKRLQEGEDARGKEVRKSRQRTSVQPTDAHLVPNTQKFTPPPPSLPVSVPTVDPIAEDERKREYAGRLASNVALSYRADVHVANPAPAAVIPASSSALNPLPTAEATGLAATFQQQLELAQAQQQRGNSAIRPFATHSEQKSQQPETSPVPSHNNPALNAATGNNHVLFEGTILESVLVNRLNGDFAGPVICQTTNDIYSHNHTELLIPAGTRLLGETKKVSDIGQERLAVVFHRLIMPDGYAVDLDQSPGLNQIGETAVHDKVNNHYFKIFGASIAVGAIAGLASIGANNSSTTGLPASSSSAYREGVTESMSQSSLHILDRFLNIPPTITIREGHRVRVFLTQDLLVPAYAQHKMPSDL